VDCLEQDGDGGCEDDQAPVGTTTHSRRAPALENTDAFANDNFADLKARDKLSFRPVQHPGRPAFADQIFLDLGSNHAGPLVVCSIRTNDRMKKRVGDRSGARNDKRGTALFRRELSDGHDISPPSAATFCRLPPPTIMRPL